MPPTHPTVDTELWSTIDLGLRDRFPMVPMQWFSYGLSQQVANSTRLATRADTNIVRDGYSGLQQDCSMKIRAWRARAIGPQALLRSDAWWAWCATLYVRFTVNFKTVAEWTLDELLRAPRLRAGIASPGSFSPPIELQSNIGYDVRLEPTTSDHGEAARRIAIAADPAYAILPPDAWPSLKLRCYLRGDLTRPVVY